MDKLEEKLKMARKLIEDKLVYSEEYASLFYQIYPFTTQNLKAQYSLFDLKDKEVLTVLGSGDQVLELFLAGVTKIDAFDINPLSDNYLKLKLGSFKAKNSKLEYLDFFRYNDYPKFEKDNHNCFNIDTFRKIAPHLDQESYRFWMNLFLDYSPRTIREKNKLFTSDEQRDRIFEKTLSYYDEDKFNLLSEKIPLLEYNFIKSDIRDLPTILTHSYDFIDLSNIIRYADKMWKEEPLMNFRKVVDCLIPFLKENGTLIVGYLYEVNTECSSYEVYTHDIRNKYFPQGEFQYCFFDGIYDITHQPQKKSPDAILTYQKVKKCHNDINRVL